MDDYLHSKRIREQGKKLDYESEALAGLARSWDLVDPQSQAMALADAQVWATLHLARMTQNNKGE